MTPPSKPSAPTKRKPSRGSTPTPTAAPTASPPSQKAHLGHLHPGPHDQTQQHAGQQHAAYTAGEAAQASRSGACFTAWPADETYVPPPVACGGGSGGGVLPAGSGKGGQYATSSRPRSLGAA